MTAPDLLALAAEALADARRYLDGGRVTSINANTARALVEEIDRLNAEWLATAKHAAQLDALQERGWSLIAAMMHALRGFDEETPVDLDDVQGCVSAARWIRAERDAALAEVRLAASQLNEARLEAVELRAEVERLRALLGAAEGKLRDVTGAEP